MVGFSASKTDRFFVCGKSTEDNLDPYHVVLTKKAKDLGGGGTPYNGLYG